MRSYRLIFTMIGVVLLLMAFVAGAWFTRIVQRNQGLPASILERARAGIGSNSDWQPVVRRVDGLNMVLVPAGCFTMGSTELQLAEAIDSCERYYGRGKCQIDFAKSETPTHEVCFDQPFWIGETEVTNRQYGSSSSTDMKNMYRGPSWPRETITWQAASDFCLVHNARLPSEAEWEYTARGPDNLIYPWGNEFKLDNLISGRLNPDNASSIPAGMSWVGAFDMSGSISEWMADRYNAGIQENANDPEFPIDGQNRVVRGGSWADHAAFFVRTSQRGSADPDTANSTIGFRCARPVN